MKERLEAGNRWRTLGWAFYLACSWTWCIGMFLPVLLVRDYGVWGFVVFAVPNVIGAGAMGWVLRDGASERIVQRHGAAGAAFSWVTIAFQLFWLSQMRPWLPSGMWGVVGLAVTPVAIGALLWYAAGEARWGLVGAVSAGVWGASVGAWMRAGGSPVSVDGMWAFRPGLVWLAPVMVFGFALCPYLDRTFHLARQRARGGAGTAAFVIGFAVLFPVMILMTLGYSVRLFAIPESQGAGAGPLAAHWMVQAAFTIAAHLMPVGMTIVALGRVGKSGAGLVMAARTGWGLALLVGAAVGAAWLLPGFDLGRQSAAEIVYRCFMAFYGLVFPAYVWLVMIPTRDGHSGLLGAGGRRKLLVWAGAVGVAGPMFWMGFIEQREVWLGPGLGVVLLARLVLPRGAAATRDGDVVEG